MKLSYGLLLGLMWVTQSISAVLAPTPMFETIGVEQGLPSTRVSQVASDQQGYLWVATADGLARYDGVSFKTYRHDPDNFASIPANDVSTVFVDHQDRVWVGTVDGGLSVMDKTRLGFRTWRADKNAKNSISGTDVWAITEDKGGSIWAGTFAAGLNRLDSDQKTIQVLRHVEGNDQSIASDTILDLMVDGYDRMWVATDAGLTVINSISQGMHAKTTMQQWLPNKMIVSLRADKHGNLWIGTLDHVYQVNLHDKSIVEPKLYPTPSVGTFEGVVEDQLGVRWFATQQGVLLEKTPGVFVPFQQEIGSSYSLPANDVVDIAADREGGIWLSVHEGGLVHIKPQWSNFSLFRPRDVQRVGLRDLHVDVISECADGELITNAAPGELMRIDPTTSATVNIKLPWPESKSIPQFFTLLCARDGRYWMGHRRGVSRYDPKTKEFSHWRGQSESGVLDDGLVDQLVEDRDGFVWASVLGVALYRLHPDHTVSERYTAWEASDLGREIEQLSFAEDGRLWISGSFGLAWFDAQKKKFIPMQNAPAGRIDAFVFASPNRVWIHTVDALRLFQVDRNQLVPLKEIRSSQGLPLVTATGLFLQAHEKIWLSSPRGIWLLDLQGGNVRQYGRSDGLYAAELSRRNGLQSRSGFIFMGSHLGLVGFDPYQLRDNNTAPLLGLEELSVWREGARISLDSSRPLLLGHRDRDLRVTLRGLSFAEPNRNRYRFLLSGVDNHWIDQGNQGQREWSQLPEGDFTLFGLAANPSDVWAKAPWSLEIKVLPPPWKTWYAWAAYGLLALLLISWLVTRFRRRVQRQHELELAIMRSLNAEEHSEAKSKFLADVGHEIRTPMTGMLGMAELLSRTDLNEQQKAYVQAVRHSGDHLLKIVNALLDLSRIEAGRLALEPSTFKLWGLMREVTELYQPLAKEHNNQLMLIIASDAPNCVFADEARLKQIILNLINNALKFTRNGKVTVLLKLHEQQKGVLVIEVQDTGCGIAEQNLSQLFQRFEQTNAKDQQHGSGLGLSICKRLLELMGGAIEVRSQVGSGTCVTIQLALPLMPDASESASLDLAEGYLPQRTLDILLIEDDETIRRATQELLELDGHRVDIGSNAFDALRLLDERSYDVAIFDIDLPGLDGLRLAGMVPGRQRNQHGLPLIAMTANSTSGIEQRCMEEGFKVFLRKPITAMVLRHALVKAVAPL